ncbi:MAG: hypothetical protein HYU97_05185 [Deltaproteobacteria bacterium]|nr:hypothetical protein [Deltaproteobacteria bacterium]
MQTRFILQKLIVIMSLFASWSIGATNEVTLKGKLSPLVSQHASQPPKGKWIEEEFDLDNGEHVVIYTQTKISCPGKVQLTGSWFEFVVEPEKRDGKIVTKTTESYTERHFNVSNWECVKIN